MEADRYDPFVHLANRILELARGNLPGVGQNYPVDNFCFAQNAFKTVRPTPEHGALAARRRPDILGLSLLDALKLHKEKGCVGWPNILMWGELKLWSKALHESLNEERMSQGLTPLDSAGWPVDWPPVFLQYSTHLHELTSCIGRKTSRDRSIRRTADGSCMER